MAGVLSFADYLGNADNLQCIQAFPSTQTIYTYDFGANCSNFRFALDYQTIVVNPLSFDRSGQPNFSNSQVIGYFPKVDLHGGSAYSLAAAGADFAPAVSMSGQAAAGTYVRTVTGQPNKVEVLYPANMYIGALVPDARSKACIVVASFSWADGSTTNKANISTFRFAFLQAWEPDANIGDPTLDPNYTAYTLA